MKLLEQIIISFLIVYSVAGWINYIAANCHDNDPNKSSYWIMVFITSVLLLVILMQKGIVF